MIALIGEKVKLCTLERKNCRELWDAYEPAEPIPTEPLNPGKSREGADDWFEDIQSKYRDRFRFSILRSEFEKLEK